MESEMIGDGWGHVDKAYHDSKCLYPFHISCTKLYVKYGEGMLGYCPIPLYPNSIYMIVLNVLHSARRKLSMKLQPHLPVQNLTQCQGPPLHNPFPPLSPYLLPFLLTPPPPPSPLTALSILPFHSLTFIFSHSAMASIQ